MRTRFIPLGLVSSLLLGAPAFGVPDPTPDSDAAVVLLRTDCTPASGQIENCFETMESLSDLATGWIWNTRNPSASAPLLVDIGPGLFGSFSCDGGSHVSLRGSGREQSILKDTFGVEVKNCDQMGFLDLGIHGERYGVNWIGNGFSTWSGVDVVGTAESGEFATVGWNDACDFLGTIERSVHYFHGSRVRTTGTAPTITTAFFSQCAETWFFGGEVLLDIDGSTANGNAIWLQLAADFRAFGTAIRARVKGAGLVTSNPLTGVLNQSFEDTSGFPPPLNALPGGMFHSHGAIINASVAPGVTANIGTVGIRGVAGSFSHTPGTAFVVKPGGTAQATRLDVAAGARVLSPFLWQSGATPPQAPNETNTLASADGQDIFVETDCASTSDCNAGGTETHLMIYNEAQCGSANPWFDSTAGACRQ